MSWVMAGVAVAGLVAGGIGAMQQGKEGDKKRQALEAAANLPGLNVSGVTAEALGLEAQFMPQAAAMAGRYGEINQRRLLSQEEMALPGVGAARAKDLEAITRLLGEDKEWLAGVRRRGAALGIGRGLGGSPAAQIGTLKLSDTERLERTRTGTGLLAGLLGTLRIAQTPGLETFLPTTAGLLDIRSKERLMRQDVMARAAGVPGMNAAMGGFLSQTGGIAFGAGLGGLGNQFGGGMGAGGNSSSSSGYPS